ncbi:hypothetical protein [Streptomyces sp. NPDC042319]|uniref:hypothetical protein n=1 Tax=Streptomyces sp. NPDC042319 TaxID=3154332 RepID=UPI0033E62CB3
MANASEGGRVVCRSGRKARALDSVLIAQEIPQLRIIQELNPAVELLWHPLYTNSDGAIKEISPDLQLTDDVAYRSRDKCASVMYHYLLHPKAHQKQEPG